MVDYRVRTFLQLYETMNYRRTAELLRLSQPAVSQQIHSLEGEYGCKLFVYDGRRLYRTPQADRVAAYARSALYNEQQMFRELRRPAVPQIRVGATKTIGEFVAAEPLADYVCRSEGGFTVVVDNTEVLLRKLEHEELDFALVEGAFDKQKYGHALYQRARFLGMCHASHPFAGRTVTLEDLAGQAVVLREKGSGTRAILENTLAEYGYSIEMFSRMICASSFSLIARFVAAGAGITFAYSAVGAGRGDVARFHLSCLQEEREFSVVYLRGTKVFPLIREVLGPDIPLPGEE